MQILRVSFFLDVRICVVVHSKIKPSRTELSITSALKSAKTHMNLRVSSISIFRGPIIVFISFIHISVLSSPLSCCCNLRQQLWWMYLFLSLDGVGRLSGTLEQRKVQYSHTVPIRLEYYNCDSQE